ncbi:hypothetical protein EIK77_002558 [Talaromyces pinophilus]|nr:hypothetical protein EIK77_002558 [Talaromyces pinophilus]
MARVESLLETLVARMTQGGPGQWPRSPVSSTLNEWQPPSRLPYNDSGSQAVVGCPAGKPESLRPKLAALLLDQEDVDFLLASSHGWWLIQQHMTPHSLNAIEDDLDMSFNVADVSKLPTIKITGVLLCIAICIQQLSPEIDRRNFRSKAPLQETMSGIIDFVVENVTSNDNLTGSVQGVECLALQAIYEVNAGNLRRSWVTFRKAITIAQLLGLHNTTVKSSQQDRDVMERKKHHLWYSIARGVCMLSLLDIEPG